MVTTFAGGGSAGGVTSGRVDGIGSAATFNGPNNVAVDSLGVVYVGDTDNNRVRMITPAGKHVLPLTHCLLYLLNC